MGGFLSWLRGNRRPPRTRYRFAGLSHAGKSREHNEDAFAIDAARNTAIIADGMGGLACGEIASRIVVETVIAESGRHQPVETSLKQAHQKVREAGIAAAGKMGATAVVLQVTADVATIHWVGDSRAYLWRGGHLKQLTRDHSFVQELLEMKAITASEAEHHPSRNIITRAVGIGDSEDLQIDERRLQLQPGDRLLLCSDGLSGYLLDRGLQAELTRGGDDAALAQRLIDRTLAETEAGDNLTVVCMSVQA